MLIAAIMHRALVDRTCSKAQPGLAPPSCRFLEAATVLSHGIGAGTRGLQAPSSPRGGARLLTWFTREHGARTQGQRQAAQTSHGDGVSGSFPRGLAHSIPGAGAGPQEGRARPSPTPAWDTGTPPETGKDRSGWLVLACTSVCPRNCRLGSGTCQAQQPGAQRLSVGHGGGRVAQSTGTLPGSFSTRSHVQIHPDNGLFI